MQKKLFISSSSSRNSQGKQIQKFQLPLNRIAHRKEVEARNQQVNNDKMKQVKLQKVILGKLNDVQIENKKLLEIAIKINNSSMIFSNDDKLNQVIYGIEEQMKSAFNDLIENIQQFYIDIDSKIKEIGSYIASLSGAETFQTSSNCHQDFIFTLNQQQKPVNPMQKQSGTLNQQQPFQIINHRIELLQRDLNQTKSNQKKLMTIIDKLVSKYELTHQTTIVREDPFLKNKIQNMMGRLQINETNGNLNLGNRTEHHSGQNSGRFLEGNTFAKPNSYASSQGQIDNFVKNNLAQSNVVQKPQYPQRVVQQQNPNDYSIYQELTKLQELTQKNKQFNSNVVDHSMLKKKILEKNAQSLGASTVSVQSYAYSNSMEQHQEQEQCFIRKLYSKQPPTLNKVSLKGCNQSNTIFQFNKTKEDPIDQSNKNHRQAFLITQLKR